MKKAIKIMAAVCLSIIAAGLAACAASFNENKQITVVAREDGSGTKTAFMEIIGLKGKADRAGVIIQTGTAGVLAEIKSNGQAIAYESLGYVDSEVKMLKIGGVEPSAANIKNESYKISRPLSIVYKESVVSSGLNKHFYDFLMSGDAQNIISDSGYVSLYDGAAAYDKPSNLSGTVNISGSTSLQPLMTELSEKFKAYHASVTVNVSGGGSGTGYSNADNGTSHFGMISEEFTASKASNCIHSIVAKDGIAVIVNKKNTFDNLTIEQLRNIYDKESQAPYAKWSDIK